MGRWLLAVLGLGLAVLFGWLTVRSVDWAAAWHAFGAARWGFLALCVPLLLSSIFFRALRWRLILAAHPGARFTPLLLAAGVGVGGNAILPGKLGEAVAAHALGRLADLSRIQALGIQVITRVVDLLVLFALVLGASLVLPGLAMRSLRYLSGSIVVVATLVLVLPLVFRARWAAGLQRLMRDAVRRAFGAGVLDVAQKFGRGLASAGQLRLLVAFVLGTALLWLVLAASLYVALQAFGIQLSPLVAPLILGLIAASAMLPSAPGNVGTFHYFGLLALGVVGVEPGLAAACIITYHALDMLSALALGAVCAALAGAPLLVVWKPPPEVVVQKSASAAGLVDAGTSLPGSEPGARAGGAAPVTVTTEAV